MPDCLHCRLWDAVAAEAGDGRIDAGTMFRALAEMIADLLVGFNALLMKFAEKQGANVIVRGLRAVADFEYEYQMAGMNQQLNPKIETVFLMADVSLQPIASKLVKEIAMFGGEIHRFVSPAVRDDVLERIAQTGTLGDY